MKRLKATRARAAKARMEGPVRHPKVTPERLNQQIQEPGITSKGPTATEMATVDKNFQGLCRLKICQQRYFDFPRPGFNQPPKRIKL